MIEAVTLDTRDFDGPNAYARHLAKYVTCPSSIVAATANHFGKHRAVPLERARGFVLDAAQARKARRGLPEIDDTIKLRQENDAIRAGSQKLAKVVRLHVGKDWPCGHQRTPETTHWIAGISQCKACRRARWNAGFRKVVAKRKLKQERRKRAMEWASFSEEIKSLRKSAAAQERLRRVQDIMATFEGRLPLPELLFCVAGHFGITVVELKGQSRTRNCVHARAVIMRILKDRGLSYPQLAKFVGRGDHSTALHAMNTWHIYCDRDQRVLRAYELYGDS